MKRTIDVRCVATAALLPTPVVSPQNLDYQTMRSIISNASHEFYNVRALRKPLTLPKPLLKIVYLATPGFRKVRFFEVFANKTPSEDTSDE